MADNNLYVFKKANDGSFTEVIIPEGSNTNVLTTNGSGSWSWGALTESKSFVITNPTANSDLPIWRVPYAITITAIHVLTPIGTITGQLFEYDTNGLNGSTVDADIVTTAATNTNDDGSLSNAPIAAGNYLGWKTTSVTGTPTTAIITFEYTKA